MCVKYNTGIRIGEIIIIYHKCLPQVFELALLSAHTHIWFSQNQTYAASTRVFQYRIIYCTNECTRANESIAIRTVCRHAEQKILSDIHASIRLHHIHRAFRTRDGFV